MQQNGMTRRQALQTAAATAALPLVTAQSCGTQQSSSPADLTIGIATQGFRNHTNRQLAEELAREGINVVQLFLTQTDSNYWKYNQIVDVSDMTPDRCKRIADDYRSTGVEIHSIGVYGNLIHPDPEERRAVLGHFEAMMKIGNAMDVHTFITESGHHYSDEPAPRVPYDFQEDIWYTMVATANELAQIAKRHDATVLYEPMYRSFLSSAKRTRKFMEEVSSPHIRALLDPANLLEHNDLEEMFNQLEPWIDCIHAKDRKYHVDKGVAAGKGSLDYEKFVTLAAKHTPNVPLIIEYVGPDDYKQAVAHLRNAIVQAG
jgi:sugar phosphate isomerase/epimerase